MTLGRSIRRIPVTTDLGGYQVEVALHEVVGATTGPTLAILAGTHGSEWLPVEVLRRLLAAVAANELRGRLLVVPVANPFAFNHLTRSTPLDESDGPDLNRAFVGARTTINDQLSRVLDEHVLSKCDYLVDLHFGIWGSAWLSADWAGDLPDPEAARRAREMAYAYGCQLVFEQSLSTFPGTKSAMWYAATRHGVVPMGVEIGGCGFAPEVEEEWIRSNVNGLLSVMRQLQLLPGAPLRLEQYFHYRTFRRMEPSVGGYLISEIGPEMLGRPVRAGTVAGRVISPHSLEELEVLRVSVDGIWRQVARSYPVRPGGWGFAVADSGEEGAGWSPAR